MVDINLMGEDESSEDSQREESFAKTVSLDEPEMKPEDLGGFGRETGAKPLPREPAPGGPSLRRPPEMYGESTSRTKAYLIVLAMILMALTAVFFLIPRDRKTAQKPPVETPSVTPQAEEPLLDSLAMAAAEQPPETMPGPETLTPSGTPTPSATTPPPAAPAMSPLERDLLSATRLGTYTVSALARSFSSPNDFTLITYHGNHRFFVEFLASSAEVTNNVAGVIQRNVSPLDLKTVSRSELPVEGRSLSKVLISGQMDQQAGLAGLRGPLNRMGVNQFTEWLKQTGQRHGLALKRLVMGEAASGDNLDRIPMQVIYSGAHDDVMSFLQTLGDANLSMSWSKIIVSPADRRTLSTDRLDLVMHFGFVEM